MQAQARKLSPRIVEGIQATKSAISFGATSGWTLSTDRPEASARRRPPYFSNLIQHFERGATDAKNLQSINWSL